MDHKWHVEILSSLLVTEFEFTERYVILKTVLQFGSPLEEKKDKFHAGWAAYQGLPFWHL
ncbi:hypothetical protein OUZ56_003764 [Daphnia magna]|uniref:Uncharacterized protein n=1 Tax=Daphnia magna TaxID=35525 RepID=A0ABQ9YMN3_9CRUS|nr:hypothetical protein OUZ56_003764 [Daphnia magna]